jgi:hypothetical protein
MSFPFSLYDALVGIEVPPDKAKAVIDALERDMGATLATKHDLLLLKQDLSRDIGQLRREIDQLRKDVERDLELQRASMTVRLGAIQVVTAGLLFAALKLT